MRIGIDIRSAIHEPAGIGTLTLHMVKHLASIDSHNRYFLYGDEQLHLETTGSSIETITSTSSLGNVTWHPRTVVDARYRRRLDRFVSVASLQVAALTRNFTVLIVPDLSHILLPQYHVAKSRLAAGLLMKQALNNARTIVAISNHTKADILNYMQGRIADAKVEVAPIACDEIYARVPTSENQKEVKERYLLPENYILSVGTLEPRKNYETLISAFRECVRRNAAEHLVIVGRKGWRYETIFRHARELGIESQIRFLGFVPLRDMPSLYAMANVFVYPSLYEGFGIPPLEAMTCGVPVITSNTTSLPEVTGEAAILIDPRDSNELARQLARLLSDGQLRDKYKRAGLAQSQKFSWESFARNILQIVQR